MEDDRSFEAGEQLRGLRIGIAVVDDDRLAELASQLQLSGEQESLAVMRRPLTVEVQPGLAHRDGAVMRKELGQLVQPLCLRIPGLVRMDPERGEDPALPLGDRARGPAGIDAGTDPDLPLDPGLTR